MKKELIWKKVLRKENREASDSQIISISGEFTAKLGSRKYRPVTQNIYIIRSYFVFTESLFCTQWFKRLDTQSGRFLRAN